MTQASKSPATLEHDDHTMQSDMLLPAVVVSLLTILGVAFYIASAGPSVLGVVMAVVVAAAITGALYILARVYGRPDDR